MDSVKDGVACGWPGFLDVAGLYVLEGVLAGPSGRCGQLPLAYPAPSSPVLPRCDLGFPLMTVPACSEVNDPVWPDDSVYRDSVLSST